MKQHFLHRRGKTPLCMFIIIPLLFNIAIVRIGVASPNQTKVWIDPPIILNTTLVPGKNFTINVNVSNVTNLYGYEIHLYYNTTILDGLSVELPPDHFLTPVDPFKIWIQALEINDAYNATHGRVLATVTLFWPEPVKNGSGTLITVTFEVTGIGECSLDLNPAKLGDPDGLVPIPHEDVDGYFSNTGFATPVADFTYTPTRPLVYETVTFNASASRDPDGTILSYEWDFGDGTSGSGKIMEHVYEEARTYNVTLTVTDDDGRTDTITKDVKVLLRDIAITEIKVYPTVIPAGESAVINITVVNKGNWPYAEWFNVTAYYENATAKYPIWYNETANQRAFFSVSVLRRGEDMNVIFNWNTTDIVGTRIYRISANASLVDYEGHFIPYESDTTNNARNVTVTVKAPHDVAITAVEPSQKTVIVGGSVSINVAVKNEGNETETFEVTAYYDSSVIDMPQTVVSLDANASTTLIFKWNTTGVPEGIYTIRANATIVEDEVDTADNELSGGDILLSPVPVHDIAIIDTTVKPSELIVGGFVSINITLENQGTEPETFNVTVYYDSSVINTETDVDLDTGDQTTLNFTWDTLGVPAGGYIIKAEVPPVPEETNKTNNFFTRTVTLTVKVTDHIEVVAGAPFHIVIESNSDVSDLTFNQTVKEISFKVTGELATGFCNITIPNVLLGGPYTVFVDSLNVTPIDQPSNGTHTFLYFTYPHSTQTVHIRGATVATKPIASFDILPTDSIIGKPVTFNASASEDEDGYIVRYKWNFGDANITIVADPVITHIYSSADTYTVTLTVKDNNGLSSEPAQKPITVLQPPTANFTYSPEAPIVDEAITFNATTSYDLDGEIVSYEWDFGDDTPAVSETSPNTTHSYTAAGLYTVTLTVTDDNNLTDTATADVTVLLHDIAVTSVTALPTKVTVGESISINVTVANEGNFSETFNVTVYYNGNILDTQRGITLSPGADTTLTFLWDTTNVSPDNYTISAKASVVPNETDTANSEFINGTVEVKETPTPVPVILYVAAAVAIVVIIATIMIYFIRFRKTS